MCHVAISTELSAVKKFGVVALQNRGEPPNKLLKTDHLTRIEQTASFMCVWWVASEENHFPKRQTIFVCFEELNCKKLILQTPKNQYFTELKSRVFFFVFVLLYGSCCNFCNSETYAGKFLQLSRGTCCQLHCQTLCSPQCNTRGAKADSYASQAPLTEKGEGTGCSSPQSTCFPRFSPTVGNSEVLHLKLMSI